MDKVIVNKDYVKVASTHTFVESDDDYRVRILSGDYDQDLYPYANEPSGPLDEPPRKIETFMESVVLHIKNNRVSKCVVNSRYGFDKDMAIEYKDDSFVIKSSHINGSTANPVHTKDMYIKTYGTSLCYYGVWLEYFRDLVDSEEDRRMTANDVVLGIDYIPMFIANHNSSNEYVNIRPYNHLGTMAFHMIGMPYELYPDLPFDALCLELWHKAMKQLIKDGHSIKGPLKSYLNRFFGDLTCDNTKDGLTVIHYKVGKSNATKITRHNFDDTYNTYLLNTSIVLMQDIRYNMDDLGEPEKEIYNYFISQRQVVNNQDAYYITVDTDAFISEPIYLGRNNFSTMSMNMNGININQEDIEEMAAEGLSLRPITDSYPLWDPFGAMMRSDTQIAQSLQ